MKKIFLLLIYILGNHLYNCQEQNENLGITRPTPSAAGLSTYNTIPVSIQTGIPNISYPLINLETNNKSVSINLGLNYHAANAGSKSIGDIGRGWSMLGGGIISREILMEFDERFDDTNTGMYVKNSFDDIYNFNIPGESGKFRFIRNTDNNTFEVVKLSPYTSKVEYHRSSNQATLIVDYLIITSNTGVKYIFKDYDISLMSVFAWSSSEQGSRFTDKKYRSTFYLSSIIDENGQELVKYTYIKDIKYTSGTNIIDTETHKLSRIDVKGRGVIEINYKKEEGLSKNNDEYSISSIILKTSENVFVRKYTFDYSFPSSSNLLESYRVLNSFSQIDRDEKIIEKYTFDYKDIFHFENNQEGNIISVINKVQLPTKGAVVYNFDMIPMYYYESKTMVPGVKETLADVSFNKADGTRKFAFTINETKTLDVDASGIGRLASYLWAAQFFKKVGNSYVGSHSIGVPVDPNPDFEYVQKRTFEPGEYYVELYCNEMACRNLTFTRPAVIKVIQEGEPTEVTQLLPSKEGLPRIKNIKYFDADAASVNINSVPVKIEEFEYNMFDNPQKSSGYLVEGGTITVAGELEMANPVVLYKNVKVSQGNNTGYTKYYFKAPDAYPFQRSENFWANFNLTRGGLIDKQEVYNSLNQKVSEELFDYTIEEYDGPKYLIVPNTTIGNFYIKTSWIKNESVISRNYFDSGIMETKKEIFRNLHNSKPNLERSTSFDGRIQEISYQYAQEKSNQKLLQANITGIPLETKSIVKKNSSDPGKVLSKSEIRYDNNGNYYPSSSVSYDSQNMLASEVIFNRYDSKGNLEQFTTKDGIPTSFVWGYNKTQPIAKIDGATYDQIAPYITDIVTKSNGAVISESDLQNALNVFKNNSNLRAFQITTYVYDALSRLKTSTPPSGIREVYQYDSAGRLEKVEDENGKLLKKYQYNYKH